MITVKYACDRSDCVDAEEIPIEDIIDKDLVYTYHMPEGWGMDWASNGLDEVLHCSAHRNGRPT